MKIRDDLVIDDDRLAKICRKYHISEISLFGSVLTDDFGPDSDVDVLYVGEPDASGESWALGGLVMELEQLFGRPVDLVWKPGVHWYVRDQVIAGAKELYAA